MSNSLKERLTSSHYFSSLQSVVSCQCKTCSRSQRFQGVEWSQVKARVPSCLHQKSKIALAMLDKTLVELMIEALERAIAEAGVK